MPSSAKPPLYDARGNTYVVATPDQVAQVASLPSRISHAARHHQAWSGKAIHAFCSRRTRGVNILQRSQSKPFVSDGLLVGPFRCPEGFGLLIVNTDATLAERSGNGLTIFAQYLLDSNLVEGKIEFPVAVYHSNSPSKPIVATCRQATRYQQSGIWVDMGTPTFGPGSVGAAPNLLEPRNPKPGKPAKVRPLQAINRHWSRSVFVNVGNPHCVTFPEDRLPHMRLLSEPSYFAALSRIANSAYSKEQPGDGMLCELGINLQWAKVVGHSEIQARVFERGEGPTKSSGSSAVAVAAAARYLGLVEKRQIRVVMPGGVAPIEFTESGRAVLFGRASRVAYSSAA
jgi:diaminopimelate epimerase